MREDYGRVKARPACVTVRPGEINRQRLVQRALRERILPAAPTSYGLSRSASGIFLISIGR